MTVDSDNNLEQEFIDTDVLVIGAGGAGIRAAIDAKKHKVEVLLVSKPRVGFGSNTSISGGAFNAGTGWSDPNDNPEIHFRDTVTSGRFINDQNLVDVMTNNSEQQIHDLEKFGVKLRKRNGDFLMHISPGHSFTRTFISENASGTGLTLPLRQYAESVGVRFVENVLITKLLKVDDTIVGAIGVNEKGDLIIFRAKTTILTTGGLGQIFLRTNNTAGATGDGYALAYDAGLTLKDMEFIQFYPTSLGKYGTRIFFYESFITGAGACIKNALGEDILEKYNLNEPKTMTRDRFGQTIMLEILNGRDKSGFAIIDVSNIPAERRKQLNDQAPKGWGIPQGNDILLTAPTTHFTMGGIQINGYCETGLNNLYAAGEVCSGIHGANRIGGNAITEILVFGTIAGNNAAMKSQEIQWTPIDRNQVSSEKKRLQSILSSHATTSMEQLRYSLKQTMWYKAGIIRNKESLTEALKEIRLIQQRYTDLSINTPQKLTEAIKLSNMITVSEMVIRAALERTESRGAHYRTDYPMEDNQNWLKNIFIARKDDEMNIITNTVELAKFSP